MESSCNINNVCKETMYGTKARVEWFKKFINKDQCIIDLGCGTGVSVTIPLILQGYNVIGVDLDGKSIEYGKSICALHGIDVQRLICTSLQDLAIAPDVIILSQVLEHLHNGQLTDLLNVIMAKIKPGGMILITVPNGYGWFEMESFLWHTVGVGWLFDSMYITECIIRIKNRFLGTNVVDQHPSSLDSSPHVQRFTYRSIEKKLVEHGFSTITKQGGAFFSGPFSNLFFTGLWPVMVCNIYVGRIFSWGASDFYIAVQKKYKEEI